MRTRCPAANLASVFASAAVLASIVSGTGCTPDSHQREQVLQRRSACPSGDFPASWIDGTRCNAGEPTVQVHRYDDNTFILRQSLCTNFEAPFMYLLFGEDRVLLEDTGAGGIDIRGVVDGVIEEWLEENKKSEIELVVVNSHQHSDHTAGNAQFARRSGTRIVGVGRPNVSRFFGIESWPTDTAEFDLGGRVLDIVPIPGHDCLEGLCSDIAIYDRENGLLLTGDTFYPGRLFIRDADKYTASIDRLVSFTDDEKERPVCAALGAHIELNAEGVQFGFGAQKHPNEHSLPLSRTDLLELQSSLSDLGAAPEPHDHFVIFPL